MEEEDDFGDFGGFEAAEPIPTAVTASVAASPSPWAVFTPAPTVSTESTSSSATAPMPTTEGTVSNQPDSTANTLSGHNVDVAGTDSSDPQSDESFAVTSVVLGDQSSVSIHPGFGGDGSVLPSTAVELGTGAQSDALENEPQNGKDAAEKWLENLTFPPSSTAGGEGDSVPKPSGKEESPPNAYYEEQITVARNQKQKLEKELESLREKQSSVESELAQCQTELAEQKQKYQDIQVKHASELEAMRQAGMDALALIVEEYKELCKVTVMEQQEACERQMRTTVQTLTDQCQQSLQEQHSRHLSSLEEEKSKHEAMLAEALAEQQQRQQSKFEETVEEEKKSLRDHIAQSMEAQKEANEKSLASAVEMLKVESKAVLSEQKEWLGEEMGDRLEVMKSAVLSDLSEKQKEVEISMKESLDIDREKLKDQFRLFTEKSKEDILQFSKEQKQAEGVVRQRQLSSVQLFLQTAQSQVTQLLSEVSHDQQSAVSDNR